MLKLFWLSSATFSKRLEGGRGEKFRLKGQAVYILQFFFVVHFAHFTINFDLIFLARSPPPPVHKPNSQFACNFPLH